MPALILSGSESSAPMTLDPTQISTPASTPAADNGSIRACRGSPDNDRGDAPVAHAAASRIIAFSISASTLAIALVPRSWPISMSVCVSCANSRTGT